MKLTAHDDDDEDDDDDDDEDDDDNNNNNLHYLIPRFIICGIIPAHPHLPS